VTHLRKRILEELQRRNYSESTIRGYLQAVQQFAVHFGKSPDTLGPDDLRSYQAHLLTERKLAVESVVARVAALRFFFVRTLKRRDFREELPYPKDRLPQHSAHLGTESAIASSSPLRRSRRRFRSKLLSLGSSQVSLLPPRQGPRPRLSRQVSRSPATGTPSASIRLFLNRRAHVATT
jgi:site-specific recombinase XerD